MPTPTTTMPFMHQNSVNLQPSLLLFFIYLRKYSEYVSANAMTQYFTFLLFKRSGNLAFRKGSNGRCIPNTETSNYFGQKGHSSLWSIQLLALHCQQCQRLESNWNVPFAQYGMDFFLNLVYQLKQLIFNVPYILMIEIILFNVLSGNICRVTDLIIKI